MPWIIIGIIVVLALIFSVRTTKKRSPVTYHSPIAYRRCKSLFSPAERSFLGVLEQAVGNQYKVFGKVRLADIVLPRHGLARSQWQKAFNRISSKHLDFVLCKQDDLSIVCALELNDKSHQQIKRQNRDRFLKQACDTAHVPLLMLSAKRGYAVSELKSQITKAVRLCPKCSAPMVLRTASKGIHAGETFWGCANYPRCKGMVSD